MSKNKSSTNLQPPRLLKVFKDDISPKLVKDNKYDSPMQVPRILKIVLNFQNWV